MQAISISELNERSREIFRHIVDAYMESGEPVGSRTLSRRLGVGLSPATIRNVMADLEEAGLLFAPHTSAGRLPTDIGLRMFVDGLLELGGNLTQDERASIDGKCTAAGRSFTEVLEEASQALAGLSQCAGLVISPKRDLPPRHVEFVRLSGRRSLVVIVNEAGMVENRVIDLPAGLPAASLVQATNYLNARLDGSSFDEVRVNVRSELEHDQAQLDTLAAKVVEAGLASWAGDLTGGSLIIRGQATLLDDVTAVEDLERIRILFQALERKENLLRVLDATNMAAGVQIFIGSENELFEHTGCAMIIAPYRNTDRHVVGAIGVIGPTRMNYARIIPMVDYTSRVIGQILS